MGMYDNVEGIVTCPECGKETVIGDQIKWLEYDERSLKTYTIGDDINVEDGVYDWGSYVRPLLHGYCEHCSAEILFEVKVEDHKIKEFIVKNPGEVIE